MSKNRRLHDLATILTARRASPPPVPPSPPAKVASAAAEETRRLTLPPPSRPVPPPVPRPPPPPPLPPLPPAATSSPPTPKPARTKLPPASPEVQEHNRAAEEAWLRDKERAHRASEESRAAAVLRRKRGDALLVELQQRWPAAFTSPVPLARGIDMHIRDALRAAGRMELPNAGTPAAGAASAPITPSISWKVIRSTVAFWTSRRGYLEQIAAGGARFGLDGQPDGEVTASEVERAAARLAVLPSDPEPATAGGTP